MTARLASQVVACTWQAHASITSEYAAIIIHVTIRQSYMTSNISFGPHPTRIALHGGSCKQGQNNSLLVLSVERGEEYDFNRKMHATSATPNYKVRVRRGPDCRDS